VRFYFSAAAAAAVDVEALSGATIQQLCDRAADLKKLCVALVFLTALAALELLGSLLGGGASAPLATFCIKLLANDSASAAAVVTTAPA
jgi:hypothetical protein